MLKLNLGALLVLTLIQTGFSQTAAAPSEPALSRAETAAVNRQIATLHSTTDRSVANEWNNAKKVAELLCRPAALPVLKKKIVGSDRVFLGTDDPKTLNLESDQRLTGMGSARAPKGWQDFTFTCELDPANGKVTAFDAMLTPSSK